MKQNPNMFKMIKERSNGREREMLESSSNGQLTHLRTRAPVLSCSADLFSGLTYRFVSCCHGDCESRSHISSAKLFE